MSTTCLPYPGYPLLIQPAAQPIQRQYLLEISRRYGKIKEIRRQVVNYLEKNSHQDISISKIHFPDNDKLKVLLGEQDKNRKVVEKLGRVKLNARGSTVSISGGAHDCNLVKSLLSQLYGIIEKGYPLYPNDVDYAHRILSRNSSADLEAIFLDTVFISSNKKVITPKSIAQKLYIDSIRKFDIVFGVGPAGTGKTYLAMAMAVGALLEKSVSRIILTRPAVEAGERLGFLPGDLSEKVNPYLRPVYDALYDMMDFGRASALISKGIIEVAPLAFMRGRTLNDSFVILDEAQNTSSEQMKMFLTRLGFGSKAVITGDVTQTDLPPNKISGLIEVESLLKGIEDIRFVYFSEIDVVRHRLVQEIIRAYNHLDSNKSMADDE
ncbi:MAG: PhoH family protein [Syntrophobacterales bacterium]|nr:MAG: PhoH family protein [Syntrophobacterales bacterium]